MSSICGNINFSLTRLRSPELHAKKLIKDHKHESQRSFLVSALDFALKNSGFSCEYTNSFFCSASISDDIIANAVILERIENINAWNVYYFVVDYDKRRHALGSKTLGFIKSIARSRGIHQIDACVLNDNHAALKFWSKNGFTVRYKQVVVEFEGVVHLGSLLRYDC
ncbi:GNAT family N-acetyltransferase [Agrobacterium vitis]|uniref:GNAT family N-acetyltransferase n=1 Tax=Allorhizobium ampelinum TaxID=3025782 RepID=UPI001F30DF6C|nr:GNAT family N-acetyltransferase [Allorhizobium ampelinum]MCF1470591.1 GNAT family N-acetyltransferase [Allorhizobium ampelinum]